jgi:prepilin-type N-terminal cleavage/methylation domain-containing protein
MAKICPKKRGFTIIEVVLVLAIAGLIFLMVFIALPALQRSQRNTQRKQDVDRVYAGIIEYQKNNRNRPPCKTYGYAYGCTFDENFITRYVDNLCEFDNYDTTINYKNCGEQFTDPDGTIYSIYVTENVYTGQKSKKNETSLASATIFKTNNAYAASENDKLDHTIFIAFGFACSVTEGKMYSTAKLNDFIVAKELEGGGWYCHGSYTGTEQTGVGYSMDIKPDLDNQLR